MAQVWDIREHMAVSDAAGVHVGTVDHVEGDRIRLTRADSPDGAHHHVPLAAVARVDAQVHLNQSAAALGLPSTQPAGGTALPPVLNRAVPGAKPRSNYYLPWIVGLIGVLLFFFLLKGCVDERKAATRDPVVTNAGAVADGGAGVETPAYTSGLGAYLAGSEPAPRSFAFEKLNFGTASSGIRPADRAEVDEVAAALKQHGDAKIRIAGYADARGSDPKNMRLGKARAEAVKAALVAQGVDAARIETVSGGERDPVNSNATAPGQAENRRTELIVTQR